MHRVLPSTIIPYHLSAESCPLYAVCYQLPLSTKVLRKLDGNRLFRQVKIRNI